MLPTKKRLSYVSHEGLGPLPLPKRAKNVVSPSLTLDSSQSMDLMRELLSLEQKSFESLPTLIRRPCFLERNEPPRRRVTEGASFSDASSVTSVPLEICVPSPSTKSRRCSENIKSINNPLDLLSIVSSVASPVATKNQVGPLSRKGMIKYPNGCRYVGSFLGDKRHGYGTCWYPNGCMYSGYWVEGKRYGTGKMAYFNGHMYDGEWKDDLRHGSGIFYWKDGHADVCRYYRQHVVGVGLRWSPDRLEVWRLVDGERVNENTKLSLEDGKMIGVYLGLDGVPKKMKI